MIQESQHRGDVMPSKSSAMDLWCDLGVGLFAFWTLACWVSVAAGFNLRGLTLSLVGALVLGGGIVWFAIRTGEIEQGRVRAAGDGRDQTGPEHDPNHGRCRRRESSGRVFLILLGSIGIGLGLLLVISPIPGGLVWACCVFSLSFGCLSSLGRLKTTETQPVKVATATDSATANRSGPWLWTLSACGALYALLLNRPDQDDTFYISISTFIAEFPRAAILGSDTLFGHADWPLLLPAYRAHSYEALLGALSVWTGVPPIWLFHFGMAALGGMLVPVAYSRLYRELSPHRWMSLTITTMLLLAVVGDTHRWYGNFAFSRIWQGKAMLVSVFIPLIWAFAFRFARRRTLLNGLLLSAVQIGAAGMTSTGLWLAPLACGLGLLAAIPSSSGFVRAGRLILSGWLSSLPVLIVALVIRHDMRALVDRWNSAASDLTRSTFDPDRSRQIAIEVFRLVHGNSTLAVITILVTALAWLGTTKGSERRFATIIPFLLLLTILNPYLAQIFGKHVTGPGYWRVYWLLPVPVLLSFVLSSPRQWTRWSEAGKARLWGPFAWIMMLVVFLTIIPERFIWSRANQTTIRRPTVKIDPSEYRIVTALRDSVPPGSVVLAPPRIALWLPTLLPRVYPLTARGYLNGLSLPPDAATEDRNAMTEAISPRGQTAWSPETFAQGLQLFEIKAVALDPNRAPPGVPELLEESGFRLVRTLGTVQIWTRDEFGLPTPRPRP